MLTSIILAIALLMSTHSVIDVIKASRSRTLVNLSPMLYFDMYSAAFSWGFFYYLIH